MPLERQALKVIFAPRLQRKYMLIVENLEGIYHEVLTPTVHTVVSYSDFFFSLLALLFHTLVFQLVIIMCTFLVTTFSHWF